MRRSAVFGEQAVDERGGFGVAFGERDVARRRAVGLVCFASIGALLVARAR
jgi:hypothetical protein